MSASATAAEQGVFTAINKFRADPSFIQTYIQGLKTGIARLDPQNRVLKEYDAFLRIINMIEPAPALRYSEDLSEAARKYLEKCKAKEPAKKILTDAECNGIVPPAFMENENSYTMVAFHDTYVIII